MRKSLNSVPLGLSEGSVVASLLSLNPKRHRIDVGYAGTVYGVVNITAYNPGLIGKYQGILLSGLMLFLTVAVLLGAVLAWSIKDTVNGLRELTTAARRFVKGEADFHLIQQGGAEIADTIQSLTWMSNEIKAQKEQLEEQAEVYRQTIELLPSPVYLLDDRMILRAVNHAWENFFNHPSHKVIGKPVRDIPYLQEALDVANEKRPRRYAILGPGRSKPAVRYGISTLNKIVQANGVAGYVGAITDVTELIRARSNLRDAHMQREVAEIAAQAKTEFVAKVSHDLKTPLNSIVVLSDLLKEERDARKIEEYVEVLQTNSQALLGLIAALIDSARLESGNLQLSTAPIAVKDVLRACTVGIRPLADRKGLELKWNDCTDGNPVVRGDKTRITQVLNNLLSNAVRYSDEGSIEVEMRDLRSTSQEYRCKVIVRDSGAGMTESDMKNVVGLFHTAGTANQRGGTGLGLYICEQLVALMDGELTLERNIPTGTVASFTMILPRAERVESEDQPRCNSGVARGKKILIVDDNRLNGYVLDELLKKNGAQCDVCERTNEALALAESNAYDFYLFDYHIDTMNGVELANRVRGFGVQNPIFLISADAEIVLPAEDRGSIDGILEKPVTVDRLLQLMCSEDESTGENNVEPFTDCSMPAFDWSIIRPTVSAIGAERYVEYVQNATEASVKNINAALEAANDKRWDVAHEIAGQTKSTFDQLGLSACAAAVGDFLHAIRSQSLEKVSRLVDDSIDAFRACQHDIETILKEGEGSSSADGMREVAVTYYTRNSPNPPHTGS